MTGLMCVASMARIISSCCSRDPTVNPINRICLPISMAVRTEPCIPVRMPIKPINPPGRVAAIDWIGNLHTARDDGIVVIIQGTRSNPYRAGGVGVA